MEVIFPSGQKFVCLCLPTHALLLSHVQLFAIPWIVALQAPLSMEFFRREELDWEKKKENPGVASTGYSRGSSSPSYLFTPVIILSLLH